MTGLPVPLDIVFFALVAVVLGWRLFIVVGRRVRVEGPAMMHRKRFAAVAKAPSVDTVEKPATTRYDVPQSGTRVGQVLADMRQHVLQFQPSEFAEMAEKTFREVVSSYARGDLATLRQHLSDEMLHAFKAAIEARLADKQKQITDIIAVEEVALIDAGFGPDPAHPSTAFVDVRYFSRQVSFVADENHLIVSGTESITDFSELWRFEHSLKVPSSKANWCVSAVRAA